MKGHDFLRTTLLSAIAVLALSACSSEYSGKEVISFAGKTMGTTYTVKVIPPVSAPEEVHADITRLLSQVDARMSTYRKDSEISRFNRGANTEWMEVSADTLTVIDEALRVSRLSGGAFDVTVGPLVDLWGFGPNGNAAKVPSAERIREGLASMGYIHLLTRGHPPSIKKDLAGIQVDLSAIAKGYAVDVVAAHLDALDIQNYMVEIGGELKVRGYSPRRTPWTIAIETPDPGRRGIHALIRITDKGLATSGDYRNYFEKNGQRFSHVIDPRTGGPIRHKLASVTVISPSAMHADAVATALMTLGPEEGYKLAEREKLAVFFIVKGPEGFVEKQTPRFGRYLVKKN